MLAMTSHIFNEHCWSPVFDDMNGNRCASCYVRVKYKEQMKFVRISWDELNAVNFVNKVRDEFDIEDSSDLMLSDNLDVPIPRAGFEDIIRTFHHGSKFYVMVQKKKIVKPKIVTAKVSLLSSSYLYL